MDISSELSDVFSFKFSYSMPAAADRAEPASSSETGTVNRSVHSDEEVYLLATSRPKKRAGRRIFKETRHPIYRGVRKRNKDKWVCELREPNKKTRIWLGTYPTPEMAARAHDVAALAFRGKSACLNFADSAWRLPVPASMDPIDIRRAAAEAAEAFRPQELDEHSAVIDSRHENENENVKASDGDGEVSSSDVVGNLGSKKVQFVDEEEMFDMPTLLVSMAEGLLLSPPRNWDDADSDLDVSLWSYSI